MRYIYTPCFRCTEEARNYGRNVCKNDILKLLKWMLFPRTNRQIKKCKYVKMLLQFVPHFSSRAKQSCSTQIQIY